MSIYNKQWRKRLRVNVKIRVGYLRTMRQVCQSVNQLISLSKSVIIIIIIIPFNKCYPWIGICSCVSSMCPFWRVICGIDHKSSQVPGLPECTRQSHSSIRQYLSLCLILSSSPLLKLRDRVCNFLPPLRWIVKLFFVIVHYSVTYICFTELKL